MTRPSQTHISAYNPKTPHIAEIKRMWGCFLLVGPTGIEPMTYSV